VRNLIRRFVEAGVTGYHIEDQRPGTKKCGHQGGKVLVPSDEQIKRLNTRRASSSTSWASPGSSWPAPTPRRPRCSTAFRRARSAVHARRTNLEVPPYKLVLPGDDAAVPRPGHGTQRAPSLCAPHDEYAVADAWLAKRGLTTVIDEGAAAWQKDRTGSLDALFDRVESQFVDAWQDEAGLETYGEAVAEVCGSAASPRVRLSRRRRVAGVRQDRLALRRPEQGQRTRASNHLGLRAREDPEGYYQVRGGIDYAIAKSLAAAPFADMCCGWRPRPPIWPTPASSPRRSTPSSPDKMLAYNLSPSFNWDTTGMSDDEMRAFPEELGKMGFVFNFITYGGHQIDGVAAEEFATALRRTACWPWPGCSGRSGSSSRPTARRRPSSAGRAATPPLAASSGRTATTKAMGKGSTQHQHLVQTEVPKKLLEDWLALWSEHYQLERAAAGPIAAHARGSECSNWRSSGTRTARSWPNVLFAPIKDRHGRSILSVRDQNTFDEDAAEAADDVHASLAGAPLQGRRRALRHPDRGQPTRRQR
jgi:isocitrate lyase